MISPKLDEKKSENSFFSPGWSSQSLSHSLVVGAGLVDRPIRAQQSKARFDFVCESLQPNNWKTRSLFNKRNTLSLRNKLEKNEKKTAFYFWTFSKSLWKLMLIFVNYKFCFWKVYFNFSYYFVITEDLLIRSIYWIKFEILPYILNRETFEIRHSFRKPSELGRGYRFLSQLIPTLV